MMRPLLHSRAASATGPDPAARVGSVTPLPLPAKILGQTGFDRAELARILDLYGRMVAAGRWRDYGMSFERDVATFCAYRRTAERPEYRIEKRPALRSKQGMWALINESGATLKRGHDLSAILAPVERRLMKLVD